MTRYFFDTSAAVKYYHSEAGSEQVAAIFAAPGGYICLSSLGVLEIQSALAIKVRSHALDRKAAETQRAKLVHDINLRKIDVYTVTYAHFAAAGSLISHYGFTEPLKTLDSVQLAVALDLSRQGLLDVFVVADRTLADIATREGLRVLNPARP